jgi:methyl-accepting chemotaxis protein
MDPQMKTGHEEGPKRAFVRRKYLIDPATQLRFGFALLFILLCGTAAAVGLWVVGSHISADGELAAAPDPAASSRLVWWVNAMYFVFAAATLLILSIRFTHRFIGPGRVIARALSRMCEGDFSSRLTLRRHDKLQDVAESAARLASQLEKKGAWLNGFASGLDEAIASGDWESVREHSARLRSHLDGGTLPVESDASASLRA